MLSQAPSLHMRTLSHALAQGHYNEIIKTNQSGDTWQFTISEKKMKQTIVYRVC